MSAQVKAAKLVDDYGFSARYWTKLAAAGKIPGARQPSGPGGCWVFDLRQFRLWWAAREAKESSTWPVFTGEERRGGAAFKEAARNIEPHSKRDLKASLAAVLRNGSNGSMPHPGARSRG